jgi:hypothetical protein
MFRQFTTADTEFQSKGGRERALMMSPERRTMVARQAAYRRWYRANADDLERVECYLRLYAKVVARALVEGNDDRVVKAAAAMGQYERMKIVLRRESTKDITPALSENDSGLEAKLAAARQRRTAAMTAEERNQLPADKGPASSERQ